MERKRLDQIRLAEAVGASRSAVNSWINDRSYPEGWRIVALEEALGIELPRWADDQVPDGTTPPADAHERELWDLLTSEDAPPGDRLTPAEAWEVIEYKRRAKRRTA